MIEITLWYEGLSSLDYRGSGNVARFHQRA